MKGVHRKGLIAKHSVSCPGKIWFRGRKEAMERLTLVRKNHPDESTKQLRPYHCEACGCWHLGNRKKR